MGANRTLVTMGDLVLLNSVPFSLVQRMVEFFSRSRYALPDLWRDPVILWQVMNSPQARPFLVTPDQGLIFALCDVPGVWSWHIFLYGREAFISDWKVIGDEMFNFLPATKFIGSPPWNHTAARKWQERAGFQLHGRMVKHITYGGVLEDLCLYERVKGE